MNEIRLALVGFGNVAQGLVQILAQDGPRYEQEYGLRFCISAISDPLKGTLFTPTGADPAALLSHLSTPAAPGEKILDRFPGEHPGWDALEMIQVAPVDAVVELSYTDLQTGEPATAHIAEALTRKKHVVTTNKGPIALHYDRLAEIARAHEVQLGVEGTVMSGTPALRLGMRCLMPAGINAVQGILNGTTNYILTQMEQEQTYAEALAGAQAQGYAEADPTGDVEGFDAAAKVAILSRLLLDTPLAMADIERQGITALTLADVIAARAEGQVWKLVGSLERVPGGVKASIKPQRLPANHPLARVGGATNAIRFSTRYLGDVTLIGPGAGRLETGMAVLQDLLEIFTALPRSMTS